MKTTGIMSWITTTLLVGMLSISCDNDVGTEGILWRKSPRFLCEVREGTYAILCSDRILYMTREESNESTKSWSKDRYYVHALDLRTGNKLYETYLTWNNGPLQGSIQAWGKKAVFVGYTQTGLISFTYIAAIIDEQGRLHSPILSSMTAPCEGCVDEKNGLLVIIDKRQTKEQELVVYQLDDGEEVGRYHVAGLRTSVNADGEGNICVAMRSDDWMSYINGESNRAAEEFVQYQVKPWEKNWSTTVTPEVGCVGRIAYERRYLRFSIVRRDLRTQEGRADEKWAEFGIDKVTGDQVQIDHLYVPGVWKIECDGRYYIVRADANEIRAVLSPDIPDKER